MRAGKLTREQILEAGCVLWGINPASVTCRAIARALDITHPAILYHFTSTEELKNAIAEYAVKHKIGDVIAHLILINHPSVQRLSISARERYLKQAAA